MIYPGAFNMVTGPLHWELLQRARAVDNQVYVAACSPARDLTAGYHAWGHSTVVAPTGQVVATMEEGQGIVYADLGMNDLCVLYLNHLFGSSFANKNHPLHLTVHRSPGLERLPSKCSFVHPAAIRPVCRRCQHEATMNIDVQLPFNQLAPLLLPLS